MTYKRVSVIIPTCDRPALLKEALASVVAQTLSPFETIIANNGKERINESSLPKEIRVLKLPPYIGAAEARNRGAAAARGDFLAFLDDDDLWSNTYLEQAARAIEAGARCVISRLDKKIGEEVRPFKNPHGRLSAKNILLGNPGITGSNIVIEKKLFESVGGFDPKLPPSEDKSLVLELLRKGVQVTALPDNQAIIREHRAPRLSDAAKMAWGIAAFTDKYSALMDAETRLYNRKKIYWYRCRAGHPFAFILYLFYGALLKLVKLLKVCS